MIPMKNKDKGKVGDIALIAVLAVLIIALLYVVHGLIRENVSGASSAEVQVQNNAVNSASGGSQAFNTIDSGNTDTGSVEIALTPHEVKDGKMAVDIATNTHSVTMSQFDLTKITTLEYDGKIIHPSSVPQMEGHHIGGTIVFDVDSQPSTFTIRITGIPSVQERVFSWQ